MLDNALSPCVISNNPFGKIENILFGSNTSLISLKKAIVANIFIKFKTVSFIAMTKDSEILNFFFIKKVLFFIGLLKLQYIIIIILERYMIKNNKKIILISLNIKFIYAYKNKGLFNVEKDNAKFASFRFIVWFPSNSLIMIALMGAPPSAENMKIYTYKLGHIFDR